MHNCALHWVAFPREFAPLWEASRHEKSQYTVVPTSKEFSSCYYATIQATWQATHFTAVLPGFNVYSTDAAAVLRPKGKSSKNRKPWNVNERCVHDVRVSFFFSPFPSTPLPQQRRKQTWFWLRDSIFSSHSFDKIKNFHHLSSAVSFPSFRCSSILFYIFWVDRLAPNALQK